MHIRRKCAVSIDIGNFSMKSGCRDLSPPSLRIQLAFAVQAYDPWTQLCAATYRGLPVPHSSPTRGAAGLCQVFGLTLRRIAANAVAASPAEVGECSDALCPAIPLLGRSNLVAFGASTSARAGGDGSTGSGQPVQFSNRRVQCRSNIFCIPGGAQRDGASERPRACVAVGDDSDNSVLLWDVNERRVR